MKTKYSNYFIFTIVWIGLIIFLFKCHIADPRDDFELIFNMEPIKTIISGTIVHAKSSEPIKNATVILTVTGQDDNK